MKQTGKWIIAFLAAVVVLIPPAQAAAEVEPSVIFSEVAWAGSALSNADEWLEITNLSAESIDLSGWMISGGGASAGDLLLPEGSMVQPHSTFLIANYDASNEKSVLSVVPDFVTTSLSLSNSGLNLVLLNADGTQVDRAGDGGNPFAGGASGTGGDDDGRFASMVRLNLQDGSLFTAWGAADESIGFDEGSLALGTPGSVETWFSADEDVEEDQILSEPVEDVSEPEPVEEAEPEPEPQPPVEVEQTVPDEPTTFPCSSGTEQDTEPTVEPDLDSETLPEPEQPGANQPTVDAEEIDIPGVSDTSVEEEHAEEEEEVPTFDENLEEEIIEPEVPETSLSYEVGTLRINEFVSDPVTGENEWVEIFHAGNETIDLTGWILREGSGSITVLEGVIEAGGYHVIHSPKGNLNNGGDLIEVVDPAGRVIDSLIYGTEEIPAPSDPNAIARTAHGSFALTSQPTPGSENLFPVDQEVIEEIPLEAPTEVLVPVEPPDETQATQTNTEEETLSAEATLILTELYPNSTGVDAQEEFIELHNYGTKPIDLLGWMISDESGKQFIQKDSLIIDSGGYVALFASSTKLGLNNSGDSVVLLSPDGFPIDETTYEKTTKGRSWAWDGNHWTWSSTPTPNEPNTFPAGELDEHGSAGQQVASAVKNKPVTPVHQVTIAQALTLPDTERVQVNGITLVAPGVLGKQIIYLMGDAAGIQVYKNSGDFPTLAVGDEISLTGTLSTTRGERRIKLMADDQITVLGPSGEPIPEEVPAASLDLEYVGRLIKTTGIVVTRGGPNIVIEDAGKQLTIRISEGTNIAPEIFERGETVTVTGILSQYDGSLRLLPRDTRDIELPNSTEAAAALLSGKDEQIISDQRNGSALLLATVTALVILACAYSIQRFVKKYDKSNSFRFGTQKAH